MGAKLAKALGRERTQAQCRPLHAVRQYPSVLHQGSIPRVPARDDQPRAGDLAAALEVAMAAGGVRLVIVPTDRVDNVERHREAWTAVAAALEG